jgi:hypothetical protein
MPPERSFVSAPVSREGGNGGGGYQPRPSQVKLTPDEVAAAQAAGIDLRTYTEGKLRLAKEKKEGLRP